jgi:hypothetical protein
MFDHDVEEDDRVLGVVAEWTVRGSLDGERTAPGGIWFGAATETDDRGALGEWGKAELAERNETWGSHFVILIDRDLDQFERIYDQIGNDEYVLREETEVGISAPFGVRKLDKTVLNDEGGTRSY